MSVRAAMTQRATLQRNCARVDPHGQPGSPDWQTTAHVACRIWQGAGRRSAATQRVIETDESTMLVPLTTDVASGDRVLEVCDRRGTVLYEYPIYVDAVLRRRGHLEVRLREHR
jgi:hypothetical protein